jgi:hypothetical protein
LPKGKGLAKKKMIFLKGKGLTKNRFFLANSRCLGKKIMDVLPINKKVLPQSIDFAKW